MRLPLPSFESVTLKNNVQVERRGVQNIVARVRVNYRVCDQVSARAYRGFLLNLNRSTKCLELVIIGICTD